MPKIGEYDVTIRDADGNELSDLPVDLPVHDFEGNTVTLQEVRDGHLRQADYTKKTQEVAVFKDMLTNDLRARDAGHGADMIRNLLGKFAELEDRGIINPRTGDILVDPGVKPTGDDFTTNSISEQDLKDNPLIQELADRVNMQGRDIGQVLHVITDRDMQTAFPILSEEHRQWTYQMSMADAQKRTPMQFAKALNTSLEERGQKSVDAYVEEQAKLKAEGHVRPDGTKDGTDLFTEDTVFSFDEAGHEGKKVVSPAQAANAYLDSAFSGEG